VSAGWSHRRPCWPREAPKSPSLLGIGIAEAVSGSSGHGGGSYGALPAYLPTSTIQPDSTLTGSAAHPALTSEGDAVEVRLPHGSVLATLSGPVVPGEGLPYQASATTATWTVTLSHATTRVPIATRAFSAIDERGRVYHPGLVPGQRRPPGAIRPGQTVRFELRQVVAVGEGMMRWAPEHRDLVASWDYVVEND
jgi:hypothetical protein